MSQVKKFLGRRFLDRDTELWNRLFGSSERAAKSNIATCAGYSSASSLINDKGQDSAIIKHEPTNQPPNRDNYSTAKKLSAEEKTKTIKLGTVGAADGETARRMRKGRLAISARLDLHGYSLSQAYEILLKFLAASQNSGARCVLVITGKGGRFGKGTGKLKSELPNWLNDNSLKPMILSFSHAIPRDGGNGAFYILLRNPVKKRVFSA